LEEDTAVVGKTKETSTPGSEKEAVAWNSNRKDDSSIVVAARISYSTEALKELHQRKIQKAPKKKPSSDDVGLAPTFPRTVPSYLKAAGLGLNLLVVEVSLPGTGKSRSGDTKGIVKLGGGQEEKSPQFQGRTLIRK